MTFDEVADGLVERWNATGHAMHMMAVGDDWVGMVCMNCHLDPEVSVSEHGAWTVLDGFGPIMDVQCVGRYTYGDFDALFTQIRDTEAELSDLYARRRALTFAAAAQLKSA